MPAPGGGTATSPIGSTDPGPSQASSVNSTQPPAGASRATSSPEYPGGTIDTNKRFTVLTQFVHEHPEAGIDISRAGPLKEIRRKYIQDGRVIEDVHTSKNGRSPLVRELNLLMSTAN